METQRPTPSINYSENERLFEYAYHQENKLLFTNLTVDKMVDQLHIFARNQPAIPDFSEQITAMLSTVVMALEEARPFKMESFTDYYRLVSHAALLEQLIYTPLLFSENKFYVERKEIVNGICGFTATILQETLSINDSDDLTYEEHSNLRGVINEQTVIGMLNRSQSPSRIALPAKASDDILRKTDINYWHIDKHTTHVTPVQVKSNPPAEKKERLEALMPLVTADIIDNLNGQYRLARLLVKENSQGIDTDEEAELDAACVRLTAHVEQNYHTAI